MKKLLILCMVFVLTPSVMAFPYSIIMAIGCCSNGLGNSYYEKPIPTMRVARTPISSPCMRPDIQAYEEYYKNVYMERKIEQKYRFAYEKREVLQEIRLSEIKAKGYQKIRKRYTYGYYDNYRGGYW